MVFTLIFIILILMISTAFFYIQLQKQKHINENQNSDLIRINRDQALQLNLWQNTSDVIIAHSLSGTLIQTNKSFSEILGYPADLWKDQLFINIIHTDHIHEYETYMENIQNNGNASGILCLINSDNKECVFEYTSKLHKYEDKKYIQWLGKDITKRVSLQKSLKTAEKKFEILFDLLPDSGLILDINGIILHCSRNINKLIGYGTEEILGKPISGFIVPKAHDDADNEFDTGKLEIQSVELNFIHKNGDNVNVLAHSQPFYDDKDNFIGIFVICYDQSVRKKLEQEKFQLEEQFQQRQKVEIVGMLTGGISHDFNNILSAILGFSDLALEELEDGHPAKELIDEIISAGNYGRDLVRQILLFSRKSGQAFRPVKIKPILKQSVKLIRAILPSNIELKSKILLSDETVTTDAVQIHQILFNLFTNSIHAMSQTMHGLLRFTVDQVKITDNTSERSLDKGKYIRIIVEDNGCGIDSDQFSEIFEPFFTTKSRGEGSGLGLSIVQSVVRQHGGTVTLESEKGKGTLFRILLPVSEQIDDILSDLKLSKVQGIGKILVVDKNQSVLIMMKKILGKLGYKVTVLSNPDEALEYIQSEPNKYDLVITEHLIPKYSMGHLTQLIHLVRKDLPIIVLSGQIDESTLDFQKADYIHAYLDKPVDPALLSITIAEALGQDAHKINSLKD